MSEQLLKLRLRHPEQSLARHEHCGVIPMSADEAIERAVHRDTYAREHGLPTYAELVAPPDVA